MKENIQKIKEAREKAKDYIFGKLGEDNLWRDFRTNTHGEGVDWPTAIIANCLLTGDVKKSDLEKTAEALSQRQQECGGWAFCLDGSYAYVDNKTACDADSTSAVVLFLSNWKEKYKDRLEKAKEFLLKHQKENGGFSVYLPEEIRRYKRISKDISVEGWCRDHPDVTASVVLALDRLEEKEATKMGRNYLADLISKNELHSYWWIDPTYVRVKSHEIFRGDKEILNHLENLSSEADASNFNEALYLEYKIRTGKSKEISFYWLLNCTSEEEHEGFWKGSNILRVPHPSNETPWIDEKDIKEDRDQLAGIKNTLYKSKIERVQKEVDRYKLFWRGNISDQNNLITTAQVYKTLSLYLQKHSWWRK